MNHNLAISLMAQSLSDSVRAMNPAKNSAPRLYRFPHLAALAVAASLAACTMGGPIRDANRQEHLPPVETTQQPVSDTYNVVAGDTIYVVARRFNISVRALIDANALKPPFQLNPGDVLHLPSGGDYTVVKGDTLYAVARKTGVQFSTLARTNNLSPPYKLHVGQRLMLPNGAQPQGNGVESASADTTVIQSPNAGGQGQASFAPVQSMKIEELPSPNPPPKETTTFGTASRPGLVTEAGAPTKTVTSPQSTAGSGTTYKPLAERDVQPAPAVTPALPQPMPGSGPPPAPAERTAIAEPNPAPPPASTELPRMQTATAAPAGPPAAAAASPGFIWPVKGPVLSSFGPTAKGQHNDGINIAVPKGTPVLAAGDGNVVYVGNELRGFGNLLLIKHTGTEYITAYANNDKILVRKGDHVTKGQKVALSGDTGGVGQPQLHFELRQGAKAIDPQSIMPNELSPAAAQGVRQDPG